ncbi:MAG: hypothetical protein IJA65_03095 [Acholeplasmatales bacterium]|nr:hypothetical protein [Acholeplasmatales bacterium]
MELSKTTIGIELGSTRIKAVMLNDKYEIIAQGFYDWENKFINGIWTYDIAEVILGLQSCYKDLASNFEARYDQKLTTTGAIGISGMMHGYLVFDKEGNHLAEFRTWRNTITEEASKILSKEFNFNIPQRWSVSHIYQAIINNEAEVKNIDFATTLAGYIHYKLTNKRVIGIGDGSGMFPIDTNILDYDKKMLDKFESLVKNKVSWKLLDILPKILVAGDNAGYLTKEGALLLDPTGTLLPGIPLCPPEGDQPTGMVATNSVRSNTGNASFGTSFNITIVTNKNIGLHPEINVITSPAGVNASLVHVSNGTGEINAWMNLFSEVIELFGNKIDKNELYSKLFNTSLSASYDVNGLLAYNYNSGEPIAKINEGRPLIIRKPGTNIKISDFMRMQIYSLLTTIRMGMDILTEKEGVKINKIYGHGGFFKTPIVGQRLLSAAINTPVIVLKSAGEGGPYGMALLASYYLFKEDNEKLEDFLDNKVFKDLPSDYQMAMQDDIDDFNLYYQRFLDGLNIEKEAIKATKYN